MQYTTEELQTILDLHKKWLYNMEEGKRADLRGANLRGADMSGADLIDADLIRADMSDADLRFADLSDADLRFANLRGANLRFANLSDAKNIPEIACEDFMKSRVCDSFSPDKAYNHQL